MPEINSLPSFLDSEEQLDDILTRPSPALIDFIKTLRGPLLILGAGGKMGPTLAVLARRAADAAGCALDIVAVSRFSDAKARAWLDARGVRTLNADLLSRDALRTLPDAENILYLVGLKFGTTQNPSLTWAMNTLVPAHVAERYPRARIVALSSGNVYPLVPLPSDGGRAGEAPYGAREDHPLTPLGEYPNACIARERIFEHFARINATPLVLARLSYAVELRYGVLLDMALKVHAGEPVDVSMNRLNWIWQGDANDMIVRMLAHAANPPLALNLTCPDPISIRATVTRLAELMNKPAKFTGAEANTVMLSNAARACALLGAPPTPLDPILRWIAHWVRRDGRTLGRPTHFEVRDGKY
ncbi:MAG TPA: NAD-dependent epimerase/dehydratase family protein [Planctomycetota bacterium]|nr:NAD-dependent epimerase/dehydratase family protein [Planctomycetota bacterium]